MADRWNVGEPRTFTVEYRTAAGELADPSSVSVQVLLPDRTMVDVSGSVTHTVLGYYSWSYTPATAGEYVFRVVSTGAVATVTETILYAVPPFEAATDEAHARADAVLQLARMTAASEKPRLTEEDLNRLLDATRRADGSFHLRRAAAEGWRWKAGRAAGNFSFSGDGVAVDKTMVTKHMLQMAESFDVDSVRGAAVTTVPLVLS